MSRTLFAKLTKLHLLTPGGMLNMARCFCRDGISIMALTRFAATYYPERCALVAGGKRFTYKELHELAQRLAHHLYSACGLRGGMRVGLLCRNHAMAALSLPALSRLGVNMKLLNTGMAPSTVDEVAKKLGLAALICDEEFKAGLMPYGLPCVVLTAEELCHATFSDERVAGPGLPRIRRGGELSVFTGGSSGNHKEAPRKMFISHFLPPLYALLKVLNIDEYDSVFLPLPLFHGFGLATLVISLLMGKKVCLMNRFDAAEALRIISTESVEVLPLVPAMLGRMLQSASAPSSMKSVRCIISGGDRLDRKWIELSSQHLANVLFNLYGTSEAGFFMIATPDDLLKHAEVTIGRPIRGVRCKVENADGEGAGELWVRSGWAMMSMKDKWQNTGDRVYRNEEGYYFYRGRSDNMVVCGGENVFPENVECVLNSHPEVAASRVFAASDTQFGTVLNADVELTPHSTATHDDIKQWLRQRLSRAEMPHHIAFRQISISETGKIARHQG